MKSPELDHLLYTCGDIYKGLEMESKNTVLKY